MCLSLNTCCGSVPTEVTTLSSLEHFIKYVFQLLCLRNILHFQHNLAQLFRLTKILDNKHICHQMSCLLREAIIA